jgi:hypothetical protein
MPCPALLSISPYASEDQIQAFLRETGASERIVRQNLGIAQQYFPDADSWNAADPLKLAEGQEPSHLRVYVSCGEQDGAGFYPGARRFAQISKERGVRLVWESLAGGHCVMNPRGLADFIFASFPEAN